MKAHQLAEAIGKYGRINGGRDLGMVSEYRRLIGKPCKIIKQCKSGLIFLECEGKNYSFAMYNIDFPLTMQIRPHGMGMLIDESVEAMRDIPPTMEAVKTYFKERHRTFSENELASIKVEEHADADPRIGWKETYIITYTSEETGKNWVIGFCDMPVM
jgi:hypothetical protein